MFSGAIGPGVCYGLPPMPRTPIASSVLAGLLALMLAGCQADRPPPAQVMLGPLPVAGARSDAVAAGFRRCLYVDAVSIRCRKSGVTLFGAGPYEAAVDLLGDDGRSGFRHLTLWHDSDQRALYRAIAVIAKSGWDLCYTGSDRAGDQAIFSRPGAPVRIYLDISYWGKRRIRIFPAGAAPPPSTPCLPNKSLGLLGLELAG